MRGSNGIHPRKGTPDSAASFNPPPVVGGKILDSFCHRERETSCIICQSSIGGMTTTKLVEYTGSAAITLHLGHTNPLMFSTTPKTGSPTFRQKLISLRTSSRATSYTRQQTSHRTCTAGLLLASSAHLQILQLEAVVCVCVCLSNLWCCDNDCTINTASAEVLHG